MVSVFSGATVVTIDPKGRLAIPTRHREALLAENATVIATAHPDGCVVLFLPAAWTPWRDRLQRMPSFHQRASWWRRQLLGFEESLTADNGGRVLLTPALRAHARLDREATMLGVGDHFELWDKSRFESTRDAVNAGPTEMPPGFEDFSL